MWGTLFLTVLGIAAVFGDGPIVRYGSAYRVHRPIHREHKYERIQVEPIAHGLVPPIATPRRHDGSVNLDVIPELAEFLKYNGVNAVEILGTDGEGPMLSRDERKEVIDEWVKMGRKLHMHIMVQVGGVPRPQAISTAEYAQEAGADSIITLPEPYYKPATIEKLVEYIDDIGRAAPHLPVIYYHFPNMTGVDFPPQDIVRLATHKVPNFRGIKYDTNDLSELTTTLKELKPDQELYIAADRLIAPAALLGVRSAICGSLNFWPQLAKEIFRTVEHSDVDSARAVQERLTKGYETVLEAGQAVSALKAALEIVTGIKVGPPGRSLIPVTHAAWSKLEHRLAEQELIGRH